MGLVGVRQEGLGVNLTETEICPMPSVLQNVENEWLRYRPKSPSQWAPVETIRNGPKCDTVQPKGLRRSDQAEAKCKGKPKLRERERNDDRVTERGGEGIRRRERKSGCIFDDLLLLTMAYIYYEDMRLTCDKP